MANNNIQLTPILGTDSLSNSRIVINDNFSILATELNNYKQIFNEDGLYTSSIIGKDGEIQLKIDSENSILSIDTNGATVNGKLNAIDSIFETISVTNKIIFEEDSELATDEKNISLNDGNITFSDNVNIIGDLTVTGVINGDSSGSGSETVIIQDYQSFERYATSGKSFIDCYKRGNLVKCDNSNRQLIEASVLCDILKSESINKLYKYINKPITFVGTGLCIANLNTREDKFITNGKLIQLDSGEEILIPSSIKDIHVIEDLDDYFCVIKISPALENQNGEKTLIVDMYSTCKL